MMRKFTFTLLMVLVFGSLSFGQYTALLHSVSTASPNENVSVDLDVTGFSSIGSFGFYIQFDPAVLTFQNVTGFSQSGLVTGINGGNVLSLIWTNTTPHSWSPGKLLTLNFKYNGLTSPIAFLAAQCEASRLVLNTPNDPIITPLTGTFTDGEITPFTGNTSKATIDTVKFPLGTVQVPVKYSGFTALAGSLTQKISYDAGKLTFISVTGTGGLASGLVVGASAGIITITWANALGTDLNTSQLNLNFSYTNLAKADVNFSTGCVITEIGATAANIPITYRNGWVKPGVPITSFASLVTITPAVHQGQMVDVALNFAGMPAGTNNFDLFLTYDNPRMELVSILSPMFPVTTSVAGNTIHILYTNITDPLPSINGQFLLLHFRYNGVGTANIVFASGCQFSDGSPIGVKYTPGAVTPETEAVSGNIGFVSATSPSVVFIPVTFTGIPSGTEIGAVTMNIGFDASKLTYVSTSPNIATIQLIGNILHIVWASTTPTIVNGTPFITLKFNYAASGSATTKIAFQDGCQLANMEGTIVPANWNYGGVNMSWSISGHLQYNSYPSPNLPLPGAVVYIKDGPEPVPSVVTTAPNIIASATTDVNGFFSITVPNGSYFIYASDTAAWAGVDNGDVINVRRYAINLTPNTIEGWPLRILAADVNQDGAVDNGDVIPLRRKILNLEPNPNYKAPNWLFENPTVVINGANISIDFLGICSGDVNGSYPN
jgi:hypothetical protein